MKLYVFAKRPTQKARKEGYKRDEMEKGAITTTTKKTISPILYALLGSIPTVPVIFVSNP